MLNGMGFTNRLPVKIREIDQRLLTSLGLWLAVPVPSESRGFATACAYIAWNE